MTDNWCGGAVPGLRVYGEGTGAWAAARPLWNQFAYTGSNIDDDGRVPRQEHATSRSAIAGCSRGPVTDGKLSPACAFPRPDLTASALRIAGDRRALGAHRAHRQRRCRVVGPDVPVSFYDGDPATRRA